MEVDKTLLTTLVEQFRSGRITRRQFLRYAVLLGVTVPAAGSLLAACGGGATTTPAATAGTTETATATAAATETATASSGGAETPTQAAAAETAAPAGKRTPQITVALETDVETLDPTLWRSDSAWLITSAIYDRPFAVPITDSPQGKESVPMGEPLEACGVDSWEEADDGSSISLHIRKDMFFHDGSPITATDYKFMYELLWLAPGSVAPLYSDMMGLTKVSNTPEQMKTDLENNVVVVDDYTLKLNFNYLKYKGKGRNPLMWLMFAIVMNFFANPKLVKEHASADDPYANKWLARNDVGSGPYLVESYDPTQQLVLKAYDKYWNQGLLKNDRVVCKIIPEASNRMQMIQAGALDIAYGIPFKDVKELEKDPNLTVHNYPSRRADFLLVNYKIPPLGDKLVRQAIAYAIPYDALIQNVLYGYGQLSTNMISKGMPTHVEGLYPFKYDLDKARELLKEAGYEKGFSTKISVPMSMQQQVDAAILISSELKKLNIDAQVNKLPDAVYWGKEAEGVYSFNVPMCFNQWISWCNDPYYQFFWLAKSDSGANVQNYKNQQVDKLIEDNMNNPDMEARNKASEQIQKLVIDDVAWIGIFQRNYVVVTRKEVQGFIFYWDEVMRFWNFNKV